MPQVTYRNQLFTLEKGQTILDAALIAGIDMPYSCQAGSCGTCQCTLVEGEIRALMDFDYVLTPEEQATGRILACQSTSRGGADIKVEPVE